MQRVTRVVIVFSAACVLACGGGGGGTTTDAVPEQCIDAEQVSSHGSDVESIALTEINDRRASGTVCNNDPHPPVPELIRTENLNCLARRLAINGQADQSDPARKGALLRQLEVDSAGDPEFDLAARVERAGVLNYDKITEAITFDGEFLVDTGPTDALFRDPETCSVLMDPDLRRIGLGADIKLDLLDVLVVSLMDPDVDDVGAGETGDAP